MQGLDCTVQNIGSRVRGGTHLVLELAALAGVHGDGGSIHMQLAHLQGAGREAGGVG